MKNIMATLSTLHNDESGQDLIEYALAGSLIALAAVATMQGLANGINSTFSKVTSALSAA